MKNIVYIVLVAFSVIFAAVFYIGPGEGKKNATNEYGSQMKNMWNLFQKEVIREEPQCDEG